jgi:hypothetical protein
MSVVSRHRTPIRQKQFVALLVYDNCSFNLSDKLFNVALRLSGSIKSRLESGCFESPTGRAAAALQLARVTGRPHFAATDGRRSAVDRGILPVASGGFLLASPSFNI